MRKASFFNVYDLYVRSALDAFKDKTMPSWIKDHPAFKDKTKVKKVFPSFGLKNFREPMPVYDILNTKPTETQLQKEYGKLFNALNYRIHSTADDLRNAHQVFFGEKIPRELQIFISSDPNYSSRITHSTEHIEDLKQRYKPWFDRIMLVRRTYPEVMSLLGYFIFETGHLTRNVVRNQDGTVKLITDKILPFMGRPVIQPTDTIFRAWARLTKIVNNMFKTLDSNELMIPLDTHPDVKEFNLHNVPLARAFIVFSSEGEGAWDIATMGERGFETCQSWTGMEKECLIGSILSKYVGIIYLTTGTDFKGRGEKIAIPLYCKIWCRYEKQNTKDYHR